MYDLQMSRLSETDKELSVVDLEIKERPFSRPQTSAAESNSKVSKSSGHAINSKQAQTYSQLTSDTAKNVEESSAAVVPRHLVDEFDSKVFACNPSSTSLWRQPSTEEGSSGFHRLVSGSAGRSSRTSGPVSSDGESVINTDRALEAQETPEAEHNRLHSKDTSAFSSPKLAIRPSKLSRLSGIGSLFGAGASGKAVATTSSDSGSVSSAPNKYKEGTLSDESPQTFTRQVRASIQRRSSSQQSAPSRNDSEPVAAKKPLTLRSLKEDSSRNSLSSSVEGSSYGETDAFRAASISKQAKSKLPSIKPSKNASLIKHKSSTHSSWVIVTNPSNSKEKNIGVYGGWKHVYTGRNQEATIK